MMQGISMILKDFLTLIQPGKGRYTLAYMSHDYLHGSHAGLPVWIRVKTNYDSHYTPYVVKRLYFQKMKKRVISSHLHLDVNDYLRQLMTVIILHI